MCEAASATGLAEVKLTVERLLVTGSVVVKPPRAAAGMKVTVLASKIMPNAGIVVVVPRILAAILETVQGCGPVVKAKPAHLPATPGFHRKSTLVASAAFANVEAVGGASTVSRAAFEVEEPNESVTTTA